MNEELINTLEGKILCGDNGDPLPVLDVDVVERTNKEGQTRSVLQLTATARAYLINPQNPAAGAEPLPQPVPVTFEHDVERDAHITLKQLSQALDLTGEDEVVDDGGDWLDRFDPDHPKSVIKLLREKGVYFRGTKKPSYEKALRFGDSPFYWNLAAVPRRKPMTKATIADLKAKLKAKRAGQFALAGDDTGSPF